MRTKNEIIEEIAKSCENSSHEGQIAFITNGILEVLLNIRDLLNNNIKDE